VISEGISWTHRLAIDQTQRRFHDLLRYSQADEFDVDATYAAVCEVLLWACIADEGFDIIVGPEKSPRREALERIRKGSEAGRYMMATRWARNKMAHCLARPTSNPEQLRNGGGGVSLKWLPASQIIDNALEADKYPKGLEQYNQLFDGREVVGTLAHVIMWVSEVRYDYRDPKWADRWFEARGAPDDG
jgi:hypothetical protein